MGLIVTLAGQDISDLVHEETIQIISVLGQGSGAGSEGAGESTTFEVEADLNPGLVKGAGQSRDITYQETVMSDAPAAYFRMGNEAEVPDASGNGNDGTVISGAALLLVTGATGDSNPAWVTDGVVCVRHPLDALGGGGSNMLSYQQSDIEGNTFPSPDFKPNCGTGGISQSTVEHWHGSGSLKVVLDGAGAFQGVSINLDSSKYTPGAAYTISFYIKADTGLTPSLRYFWEGNDLITGNHSIGSTAGVAHPVDSTWTRYTVTATMPNPIVDSYIGLRLDTGSTAQATTFFIDGVQIEAGSSATAWAAGGQGSITQEALIYLESSSAAGPIKYTGTYATDGFGFGIGNGANWTTPGVKLIGRTSSGWVVPSSPISLPVGQWLHVVAEWSSGTLTFYVNSVLQAGTGSYSATTPTGYGWIGGTSNGDRASGMLIDEVASFNSALSSSRIAAHYGAIGTVPVLVDQGVLSVQDATGAYVFGGRATFFEDATRQQSLTLRTKISCHDYFQDLDRVEVNEVYTGHDDVYILKDILTKYAPWIDQTALPSSGSYTFTKRYVRATSVMAALKKLAAVTGYLVWVSPDAKIHYTAPTDASQAPFGLSDNPDFSTTYGYDLISWRKDSTAITNRVYFYGGKQESDDFVQDLFPQYHGTTNTVMLLAYYPHNATDGAIHIKKNGTDLVLGNPFDTSSAGKLIADGGTAQVLLNYDAETLTFDTSVLSGITTLTATYRYNTPLVVVVTDRSSYAYYGRYYDGKLDDSTVLDAATAVQRARVLLAQQAYGLESLQIVTWQGGLMAGQLVTYVNSLRGVNTTYQVQKVQVDPLGAGHFQYTVDLGAWNWGLTDLVMATARRAGVQDDSTDETTNVITAEEVAESVLVTDTWTTHSRTTGAYRWRNTAVGDGHDAYWGLWTWGP